ncbi:MAG TPA: PAS domain S-box protein, partial [Candidatus Kryptobacter bacterium]|nr:PAS domain S-box protein [Candidatus Kryptobacter bacterium]
DPALGAAINSDTLAGGWQGELLNRRKDGTQFPIHLSSSVVRNERGEVIAMVGVARDISERRQAEEELRLFRQLVDHTNDALEVIDPESGRFLDVNQKACADLGYTRDELLRMTVFDIDPALDREKFSGAGATSGESIPPVIETLHRRKDGSTFSVEVSISAVKLERLYFVAIARDITERKALEQQYRRTQRMDILGTLASGMAHDLNNVLTPIALAIEMLQRKHGSDEKTARLLSTLESTVKRGSEVVKQILALSRDAESHLQRLDPVNVIEDVRRMIEGTFPKNISNAMTVEKGTGLLLGDRMQIYQILANLCINARDTMRDGGKLSLSARNATVDEQYAGMTRGAKAGKFILFEVRDTGTGIMKEDIEKLFDPFLTISESGRGAGLGLAIAHGLVESHGGFIEIESEVYKGTTFKVYLPAAAPGEQNPQVAPEPKPGVGHEELILIVDDEMAIREITKSTLEAYGYKVLVASDGSEAVSLFATHRDEISLVVTDMAMPIMDGSATVSALRKIDPAVSVIVTTGYMDSSETHHMSETVNAILKKPYSAAALMKVITEVLSTADSEA